MFLPHVSLDPRHWQKWLTVASCILLVLPHVSGQCTGVEAPENGDLGDCPSDGGLDTGSWCTLACSLGYELSGGQPQCTGADLYPACVDDTTYSKAHPDGGTYACTDWATADCTTSGFTDLADQVVLRAHRPMLCISTFALGLIWLRNIYFDRKSLMVQNCQSQISPNAS